MQAANKVLRPAAAVLATTILAAAMAPAKADDIRYQDSRRATRPHSVVDGSLIDVQIKVEGRNAPLYFRPSTWDRHYFEAMKGRNYSLVVHNNSGRRVGVLIAVDGLNVVNGERSALRNNESMYVLDPYEQAEIRGWRTSLDEVRRFVFVDEERSYAERTNQANGDLGWIRVLSFREVEQVAWWNRGKVKERDFPNFKDERTRGEELGRLNEDAPPSAQSEGSAKSQLRADGESRAPAAPEANPGTGWGHRDQDHVDRTEFRAVRSETDHLVMRYEYSSGLRALGIFPQRNRLWDREDGNLGFAKPPQW